MKSDNITPLMEQCDNSFYRKMFDISPAVMAVYDSTGRCLAANSVTCSIMGRPMEQILAENYHQIDSWKTSGLLEEAKKAVASGVPCSKQASITSHLGQEISGHVTFIPFELNGDDYLLFILTKTARIIPSANRQKSVAQAHAKGPDEPKFQATLPLCSFCKKIRDANGYWEQVDIYIRNYLHADISHGICPECARRNYPELFNGEE